MERERNFIANKIYRVFWNFKTEGSPEWDAFRLIDNGIFPQPLTDRKFSQICT
jgi:glucan 1,3-beta-glucosidase